MTRLFGNLRGLAPSQTKALEKLATRRTDRQRLIGVDLARELGELSWETGRSVGVLLDRAGHVTRVLVGDTAGVPLPDVGKPPQPGRLAGLRLVRTELRRDTRIGDADRALLVRYRMDALCRLVVDEVGKFSVESEGFVDVVRAALEYDMPTLLTLHKKSRHPLLQDIRRRDDGRILEVTPVNRALLPYKILRLIQQSP